MTDLPGMPLADLLDELGSASPAPGGGSGAALACALAAGLVEMAMRIELRRGEDRTLTEEGLDRVAGLRRHALELAEAELSAYAPVLEARRMPASDPARPGRIHEALDEASLGPLDIAETAAEVAELGERVARAADAAVRGDAVTGVILAEAAASAAAGLVEVNSRERPSATAAGPARAAASRAAAARELAGRHPQEPG
jgi:formiminotetrahydrofolate cyclodeaminase